MTQHKSVVRPIIVLLAASVTGPSWAGVTVFDFEDHTFSQPTSLTNDYWGLRLSGPSQAVFYSESDEGCEVSESVVMAATTGDQFFAAPYDVDAIVVHDREWVDESCGGEYQLVEDTFDWYAQDDDGNVWYLGEDTEAWDDEGLCLSTAGSWKAGEAGAVPGVVMPGDVRPGLSYRQELLEGEAEDWAKVLRLDAPVSIAFGEYAGCLKTKEYTPLERGSVEHKTYCRVSEGGAGLMLVNELKGKTRRVEYVGTSLPAGEFPDDFPDPAAGSCGD